MYSTLRQLAISELDSSEERGIRVRVRIRMRMRMRKSKNKEEVRDSREGMMNLCLRHWLTENNE